MFDWSCPCGLDGGPRVIAFDEHFVVRAYHFICWQIARDRKRGRDG